MKFAIALGVLNLAATGTVLVGLIIAKRRLEIEFMALRERANRNISKIKSALEDVEL